MTRVETEISSVVESRLILINPKYPHNVGAAVRAASCFGALELMFTGDRIRGLYGSEWMSSKSYRLPREERMRAFRKTPWRNVERPFDELPAGTTPVAVEFKVGMSIVEYEHPDNACYVFGPEDGSLDRAVLGQCHHFIKIPTLQCLNLAATINIVLYDRMLKGKQ